MTGGSNPPRPAKKLKGKRNGFGKDILFLGLCAFRILIYHSHKHRIHNLWVGDIRNNLVSRTSILVVRFYYISKKQIVLQ